MFNKVMQRLLGNNTERELKKMRPIVQQINSLEPQMAALSDTSLQEKHLNLRSVLPKAKRWTIFCPKHLPSFVKLHDACWA